MMTKCDDIYIWFNDFKWICVIYIYLPIIIRIASLALGQSWNPLVQCNEITLNAIGNIELYWTQTKYKKEYIMYIFIGASK